MGGGVQLEEITQQRGISCQSTYSKVRNISQKTDAYRFPKTVWVDVFTLERREWLMCLP